MMRHGGVNLKLKSNTSPSRHFNPPARSGGGDRNACTTFALILSQYCIYLKEKTSHRNAEAERGITRTVD
jgi:hypothetical protein